MKKITLEEAIQKSYQSKKNTFIWQTTEDVLGCVFSEEYTFKNISVLWSHSTYEFTCLLFFTTSDGNPLAVGVNSNNGNFTELKKMRQAHPRLFEVLGDFKPIQQLWNV